MAVLQRIVYELTNEGNKHVGRKENEKDFN